MNLKNFSDSFNLIFGFSNLPKNINIFDNDYFELKGYLWTEKGKLDNADTIKLDYCNDSDLEILPEKSRAFYKKSVCFKDYSKIDLKNDWFQRDWSIPWISINYCNN